MKYSIEIVKEGKPSFFFYTAQNVLLTLLPFHFYVPPPPQFYYFPSSTFYSLLGASKLQCIKVRKVNTNSKIKNKT